MKNKVIQNAYISIAICLFLSGCGITSYNRSSPDVYPVTDRKSLFRAEGAEVGVKKY